MPDKDLYIKLRKTLDSLSNVALAEYNLKETDENKQIFVDFVNEKVKNFLGELADRETKEWLSLASKRAKEFEDHAKVLIGERFPQCPPGFIEVDGICVPI